MKMPLPSTYRDTIVETPPLSVLKHVENLQPGCSTAADSNRLVNGLTDHNRSATKMGFPELQELELDNRYKNAVTAVHNSLRMLRQMAGAVKKLMVHRTREPINRVTADLTKALRQEVRQPSRPTKPAVGASTTKAAGRSLDAEHLEELRFRSTLAVKGAEKIRRVVDAYATDSSSAGSSEDEEEAFDDGKWCGVPIRNRALWTFARRRSAMIRKMEYCDIQQKLLRDIFRQVAVLRHVWEGSKYSPIDPFYFLQQTLHSHAKRKPGNCASASEPGNVPAEDNRESALNKSNSFLDEFVRNPQKLLREAEANLNRIVESREPDEEGDSSQSDDDVLALDDSESELIRETTDNRAANDGPTPQSPSVSLQSATMDKVTDALHRQSTGSGGGNLAVCSSGTTAKKHRGEESAPQMNAFGISASLSEASKPALRSKAMRYDCDVIREARRRGYADYNGYVATISEYCGCGQAGVKEDGEILSWNSMFHEAGFQGSDARRQVAARLRKHIMHTTGQWLWMQQKETKGKTKRVKRSAPCGIPKKNTKKRRLTAGDSVHNDADADYIDDDASDCSSEGADANEMAGMMLFVKQELQNDQTWLQQSSTPAGEPYSSYDEHSCTSRRVQPTFGTSRPSVPLAGPSSILAVEEEHADTPVCVETSAQKSARTSQARAGRTRQDRPCAGSVWRSEQEQSSGSDEDEVMRHASQSVRRRFVLSERRLPGWSATAEALTGNAKISADGGADGNSMSNPPGDECSPINSCHASMTSRACADLINCGDACFAGDDDQPWIPTALLCMNEQAPKRYRRRRQAPRPRKGFYGAQLGEEDELSIVADAELKQARAKVMVLVKGALEERRTQEMGAVPGSIGGKGLNWPKSAPTRGSGDSSKTRGDKLSSESKKRRKATVKPDSGSESDGDEEEDDDDYDSSSGRSRGGQLSGDTGSPGSDSQLAPTGDGVSGKAGGLAGNLLNRKKQRPPLRHELYNFVVPFGVISAPARVEVIEYKEIVTPKWRRLDDSGDGSTDSYAYRQHVVMQPTELVDDSTDSSLSVTQAAPPNGELAYAVCGLLADDIATPDQNSPTEAAQELSLPVADVPAAIAHVEQLMNHFGEDVIPGISPSTSASTGPSELPHSESSVAVDGSVELSPFEVAELRGLSAERRTTAESDYSTPVIGNMRLSLSTDENRRPSLFGITSSTRLSDVAPPAVESRRAIDRMLMPPPAPPFVSQGAPGSISGLAATAASIGQSVSAEMLSPHIVDLTREDGDEDDLQADAYEERHSHCERMERKRVLEYLRMQPSSRRRGGGLGMLAGVDDCDAITDASDADGLLATQMAGNVDADELSIEVPESAGPIRRHGRFCRRTTSEDYDKVDGNTDVSMEKQPMPVGALLTSDEHAETNDNAAQLDTSASLVTTTKMPVKKEGPGDSGVQLRTFPLSADTLEPLLSEFPGVPGDSIVYTESFWSASQAAHFESSASSSSLSLLSTAVGQADEPEVADHTDSANSVQLQWRGNDYTPSWLSRMNVPAIVAHSSTMEQGVLQPVDLLDNSGLQFQATGADATLQSPNEGVLNESNCVVGNAAVPVASQVQTKLEPASPTKQVNSNERDGMSSAGSPSHKFRPFGRKLSLYDAHVAAGGDRFNGGLPSPSTPVISGSGHRNDSPERKRLFHATAQSQGEAIQLMRRDSNERLDHVETLFGTSELKATEQLRDSHAPPSGSGQRARVDTAEARVTTSTAKQSLRPQGCLSNDDVTVRPVSSRKTVGVAPSAVTNRKGAMELRKRANTRQQVGAPDGGEHARRSTGPPTPPSPEEVLLAADGQTAPPADGRRQRHTPSSRAANHEPNGGVTRRCQPRSSRLRRGASQGL